MTQPERPAELSRRAALKAGGALIVSAGIAAVPGAGAPAAGTNLAAVKPALTPDQLSSYLAVNADGTVAAYFGKMDMGHGLMTAIAQIVAEELDVPVRAVTCHFADTGTSVNQGGASGSTGVQQGGRQMRMAAAEARRVLVDLAAARLGVPAGDLVVEDGVVHANADAAKRVSYAELVGGRYFDVPLKWNGQLGNTLYAPGRAQPKKPSEYKVVGQRVHREDVAPKVFAREDFVTDVKLPGMVHGRVLRPPVAGSVPVKVDAASIKDIPGARVVWRNGFLGVVAAREWDAIQAMNTLKVEWSQTPPPFLPQASLFDHIRGSRVRKRVVEQENGNVDEAFRSAARVIEAAYEWPYQSHAPMGPACALVAVGDDAAICYTGSQKSHFVQQGLAAITGLPREKIRVVWVPGPGSYGRNDADDCAADAAVLSMAVGKPVRLQYMREQGTGWDPKGPASVHTARMAFDAAGNITAYEFTSKGFSRIDVDTNGGTLYDVLAGHTLGVDLHSGDGFGTPAESYAFANKRLAWETVPPLLDRASPLRTSHLRDPVGPQIHFASESFMDEVAAELGADPVAFRLRHVKDPRDIAVIKGAAEKYGWAPRPAPQRQQSAVKVTGRGIAYAQRSGTRVAVIAEVEVDRSSGKIHARRFVVAHDCGLIINPDGLAKAIEGNIVQGISRTLWEEVKFNDKAVTTVDWITYPILDITEKPERIETVLINHPELASSGAGEPSIRPVAAAIANAIFDATGVRMRRVPFSPDRVREAMA